MEVRSEISPLKKVLTHRPGNEHLKVSPLHIKELIGGNGMLRENPEFILFDDITDHKKIGNEHDELTDILNEWTDGNCIDFDQLLVESFEKLEYRESIFEECLFLDSKLYGKNGD